VQQVEAVQIVGVSRSAAAISRGVFSWAILQR
jgi:hypothetical protein